MPRRRRSHLLVAVPAALVTVLTCLSGSVTHADIESDNLFIRNDYVEVGARPNGSFGSEVDAPAGWHPASNEGNCGEGWSEHCRQNQTTSVGSIGFRSDREKDGWGVGIDDGDFFVPGAPFEGFAIQVGSNDAQWNKNMVWNGVERTEIPGSFVSSTATSGTWASTGDVNGIEVEQTYSVPADGQQYLSIDVTLRNTTDADLEVLYQRSVDPDNCQDRTENVTVDGVMSTCAGSWTTLNTIVAQKRDGDPLTIVAATADDGSYLDLRTDAADSIAMSDTSDSWDWCAPETLDTFDNGSGITAYWGRRDIRYLDELSTDATVASPATCFSATEVAADTGKGIYTKVGESAFHDSPIDVVIPTTVPANGSVSFNLKYVLSMDAAADLDAALSDASLSGLVLSAGVLSPVFASDTTSYAASVGSSVDSVTLTPTTTNDAATVTVNGVAVVSGSASGAIPLEVGENTITVVVTAEDGSTTSTTTVTVTRPQSGAGESLPFVGSDGAVIEVPVGAGRYIDAFGEVSETPVVFTDNPFGELRAGVDGDLVMTIAGADSGAAYVDDAQSRLVILAGRTGVVSGEGFQPGSDVEIWLFSDPVYLGTATVESDGTFRYEFVVPTDVEIGDHTIQAEGTAANGTPRAVSAGVVIETERSLPVTGRNGLQLLLLGAGLTLTGLALTRGRRLI